MRYTYSNNSFVEQQNDLMHEGEKNSAVLKTDENMFYNNIETEEINFSALDSYLLLNALFFYGPEQNELLQESRLLDSLFRTTRVEFQYGIDSKGQNYALNYYTSEFLHPNKALQKQMQSISQTSLQEDGANRNAATNVVVGFNESALKMAAKQVKLHQLALQDGYQLDDMAHLGVLEKGDLQAVNKTQVTPEQLIKARLSIDEQPLPTESSKLQLAEKVYLNENKIIDNDAQLIGYNDASENVSSVFKLSSQLDNNPSLYAVDKVPANGHEAEAVYSLDEAEFVGADYDFVNVIQGALRDLKTDDFRGDEIEAINYPVDLINLQVANKVNIADNQPITCQPELCPIATEESAVLQNIDINIPCSAQPQGQAVDLTPVLNAVMLNNPALWNSFVHQAKTGQCKPDAANIVLTMHEDKTIEQLQSMPASSATKDEAADNLARLIFSPVLYDTESRRETIADILKEPNWIELGKQALGYDDDMFEAFEEYVFKKFAKLKFDEMTLNEYTEELVDVVEDYDIDTLNDDILQLLTMARGQAYADNERESLDNMPLIEKVNYYDFLKEMLPRSIEDMLVENGSNPEDNKLLNQFKDYINGKQNEIDENAAFKDYLKNMTADELLELAARDLADDLTNNDPVKDNLNISQEVVEQDADFEAYLATLNPDRLLSIANAGNQNVDPEVDELNDLFDGLNLNNTEQDTNQLIESIFGKQNSENIVSKEVDSQDSEADELGDLFAKNNLTESGNVLDYRDFFGDNQEISGLSDDEGGDYSQAEQDTVEATNGNGWASYLASFLATIDNALGLSNTQETT